MKMRLTVLLGCMTVFVLPAGVGATDSTAAYIHRHWEKEFRELEQQIKQTSEQYQAGRDPYAGMRVLDRQACILA